MRSRAELRIDAAGRLDRVVSSPPITFRAAAGAVYLVGTAAGPLGDDHITVAVDVAEGGRLCLRSAAAAIVYAGRSSHQSFEVKVGRTATLDWHPEPLIVTAGCHHVQEARVTLAESSTVDWTEEVILGRHGETAGSIDLRLNVDVEGVPLLRHQLVVGGLGWDGPAVLGPARTTGVRLLAGTGAQPGTPMEAATDQPRPRTLYGEGWAWLELDGPGWLLVAVAADLPELRARMAAASS